MINSGLKNIREELGTAILLKPKRIILKDKDICRQVLDFLIVITVPQRKEI